jgi:hypothetical protein
MGFNCLNCCLQSRCEVARDQASHDCLTADSVEMKHVIENISPIREVELQIKQDPSAKASSASCSAAKRSGLTARITVQLVGARLFDFTGRPFVPIYKPLDFNLS